MTATALPAAPARPPLWRLAAVELRKMADTRAGFWLLAAVLLIAAGMVVVRLLTADGPDGRTLGAAFRATIEPVSVLLPVVGILAVTSEFSQRTALTTFALVPARGRVAAAKLLAAPALALLAVVASLAAAAVGAAVAGGGWGLAASTVGSAALYHGLVMLMGLGFGLLLMSSAPAIVAYFVLPTAWAILGELIGALREPAEWLDTARTMAPLADDAMAGGDWARLAASAALWMLLPLGAGLVRLARREVA
jgi:hypothetical protein